jgi:hypothetical protein
MKTIIDKKPKQLSLFDTTEIRSLRLKAINSPRQAFYHIFLLNKGMTYSVKKESGTLNKTLDARSWDFNDYLQAEKFFDRKIKEKTTAMNRKRIYQIEVGNSSGF